MKHKRALRVGFFIVLLATLLPLQTYAANGFFESVVCKATAFFGFPCEVPWEPMVVVMPEKLTTPVSQNVATVPTEVGTPSATATVKTNVGKQVERVVNQITNYITNPVTVVYQYLPSPESPTTSDSSNYVSNSFFKKQNERTQDNASDQIRDGLASLSSSFETGAFSVTGTFTDSLGSEGANGFVLQSTGTGVRWVATSSLGISGGVGTGITTLNGQLQVVQSFASSTSGTDFKITSSAGVHTFQVPSASATARGLLTSSDWTSFNGRIASSSLNTSLKLITLLTDETGTGAAVFATAPTISSPTFSGSITTALTNGCIEAVGGVLTSTGVSCGSGSGSGIASSSLDTSVELGALVTDETGTGALVFATSPTLVTPNLGTPSTLVGTNITGTASGLTAGTVTTNANLTGMVTSVGNAASLGSFTSANLSTALTDETGSGVAVFATSPTLASTTITGRTKLTNASTTNITISGKLYDSTNSAGTNGMVLKSTGSGFVWVATSTLGISSGTSAFLALSDVSVGSFNTGRLLFETGSSVTDSASLTFADSRLTAPIFNTTEATTTVLSKNYSPLLVASTSLRTIVLAVGARLGTTSSFILPTDSIFIGTDAGFGASSAYNSNFIGDTAGFAAANAYISNFIGNTAGSGAVNAYNSNFIGYQTGSGATEASDSNFIGDLTGFEAVNAHHSNFMGDYAGYNATNGANAIFLGSYAGYNDTVDNTANSGSSIAIGRYSGTGGFSDSIALGRGVINSSSTQLNIGNVLYATGLYNSDTQSAAATANGRIGIGTSTPQGTLHLSVSSPMLYLTDTDTGSDSRISAASGSGALYIDADMNSEATGLMGFRVHGAEYMRITNTGNIGIGTTTPAYKLTIAGNTRITGALYGANNSAGSNGYVLQSTATGFNWVSTSTLGLGASGATVSSVALSAPTGFSVSGSPITTSGTLALSYAAGYEGLRSASSTAWQSFYTTPSTRITDGTGLTWSANTLNCDTASGSTQGCLTSADWSSFNGRISSSSLNTSSELATLVTDETGTGALVFATSPTLVTPNLGTPSTLVGTNITGTASGLTAGTVTTNANLTGMITSVGNAASLGSFTSANLSTALTDETGSGLAVFATAPTLASTTITGRTKLTNASTTNVTISGKLYDNTGSAGTAGYFLKSTGTGFAWVATSTLNVNVANIGGLGTGVATFLGTPSTANLASAVTGETGSGALVFGTSPTLSSTTISGILKLSSQTASRGLFTDAQSRATTTALSATLLNSLTDETGTGVAVFATSPTLVTPNLGTPSTLVGTNITGTASGLTAGTVTTNANLTGAVTSTGNATVLGSFSSANLSGALTDETGSGRSVFSASPAFSGTATFSAITGSSSASFASTTLTGRTKLTNATTTSLTISGRLFDNTSSAGTNGQILKSTGTGFAWTSTSTLGLIGSSSLNTSAKLAALITNETGSGALVFGTSPTLSSTTISGILKLSSQTASRGLFTDAQSRATTTALSATLLNSLTDETGTGVAVFGTAPTFTTSITSPSLLATANDSGALGASGTAFSDLFLASGGVINWLAGDVTLTHTADTLTLAGGTFSLATSTQSGRLTLSGSAANIALGSNYLSGDGDDEGIYVDSTGRVGIGTSNPTTTLDVVTTINTDGLITGPNSGSMAIADYSALSFRMRNSVGGSVSSGGNSIGASIRGIQDQTAANTGALSFLTRSNSTTIGERMRISSTGLVGIGTTTPSQELTVTGDLRLTGRIYDSANSAGTNGYFLKSTGTGFTWVATSTLNVNVANIGGLGTGVATFLGIPSTANLASAVTGETGSGALVFGTSPTLSSTTISGILKLSSQTASRGLFTDSQSRATTTALSATLLNSLTDETGTGVAVFSASPTFTGTVNAAAATLTSTLTLSGSAANIALGSNYLSGDGGDEGIYVSSTGNIGIGTTTPSSLLHLTSATAGIRVEPTGAINTASDILTAAGILGFRDENAKIQVQRGSSLGQGWNFLVNSNSAGTQSEAMRITSEGSIGIGTTSPSAMLTVGATSGSQFEVTSAGIVTDGTWQGDVITAAYLDATAILSTEIDTSSELLTIVTDETGTGALVFATSPTLVTPNLGTPSTLVGTNITGTASGLTAGTVTTNANLTGMVTSVGNAASLGSFTSANLSTALTDETGSGVAVFATAPTLASTTITGRTKLTNASTTNLTISGKLYDNAGSAGTNGYFLKSTGTGFTWVATSTLNVNVANIGGLGTGVATFLGTPSTANLASAVTGETGSGALVFGTSPTLSSTTISGILKLSSQTASRGLFTDAQSRATTTALSATLLNSLTDETGSGVLVFGTAPTLASTTITGRTKLTNATTTSLTILGKFFDNSSSAGTNGMVLKSTGTGFTWVATSTLGLTGLTSASIDTSSELAAILTDETGTGNVVFSASPSLTGFTSSGLNQIYCATCHASSTTASNWLRAPKGAVSAFIGDSGSTVAYTQNETSGNIRFNGTGVAWGDFGYYPTGGDAGESGHFRLSLASVNIDTTPDAKLGVGSLYSAGDVGIGTTSPEQKLSVAGGNIQLDNAFQLLGYNTTRTLSYNLIGSDSSNRIILGDNTSLVANEIRFHADGSATPNMSITTAGRVGIGTTTPAKALSITGDLRLTGALFDRLNSAGSSGSILKSTVTGQQWVATSTLGLLAPASIDTSSELNTIVTDNTGSGALVFGTAPTMSSTTITGILKLSNQTATRALFTDSQSRATTTALSATLTNSITDETGSGVLVFATAPTLASTTITGRTKLTNASTTNITISGKLFDNSSSAGTNGMVLKSTGAGFTWVATSTLGLTGLTSANIDTSAELAAIVGDETGSGALVFGTAPTIGGTLTLSGGQVTYSSATKNVIPNNTASAWTIATSSTATPLISITTTTGSEMVTIGKVGGDVYIGDVGSASNLVFEESSTIHGQGGNTLTFGQTGDKINFAVNIGIGSTSPSKPISHSSGANLSVGGTWTNSSDRNLKENFTPIDGVQVLEGIKNLDITKWNYIVEGNSIPHVGPMAQDFYAAFGLGGNERTISTVDEGGIALAGIKELARRVDLLANASSSLIAEVEEEESWDFADALTGWFSDFGIAFNKTLARFGNVAAKALTIGSQEQPNGITLFDRETGEAYCVQIEGGEMVHNQGVCKPHDDPTIEINGDAEIALELGDTYTDEGAQAEDWQGETLPVTFTLNGQSTTTIAISTSTAASYIIVYTAIDEDGLFATTSRTVIVGEVATPSVNTDNGTGDGSTETTEPPVEAPAEDVPPPVEDTEPQVTEPIPPEPPVDPVVVDDVNPVTDEVNP